MNERMAERLLISIETSCYPNGGNREVKDTPWSSACILRVGDRVLGSSRHVRMLTYRDITHGFWPLYPGIADAAWEDE